MEHDFYMNLAYQEALKAYDDGEVPIGAVIVKNNKIIGRGYNRMENLHDATAHAEIIAISAAAASLSTWRLNDCELYVTIEPCLMCLGAIMQSRISRIIFGALDIRFGAVETNNYKEQIQKAYSRFPEVIGYIMEQECSSLIRSFFAEIRKKN
jgi:tRNA(adenine34) deaminase